MKENIVVLLSGKQGSGKSTLARSMATEIRELNPAIQVHVERFAGPLYEMHDSILEILAKYGVKRDIVKDGPLLQLLGTEWGRKTVEPNLWVRLLANKIAEIAAIPGRRIFVVEDCRFKNELFNFKELLTNTGLTVKSVRLECNEAMRRERCSMWRENSSHPSETDLDDVVDKFDLVVDAGARDAQHVLDDVMDFIYR